MAAVLSVGGFVLVLVLGALIELAADRVLGVPDMEISLATRKRRETANATKR